MPVTALRKKRIGIVGGVGPYAGLDLMQKVFDKVAKKHSTKDTAVRYLFTLGNYWGKPSNKKFTIHLHVLGPHSIRSLQIRINRFQKVVLGNAIHNSKIISGVDLRQIIKIKISPQDVLFILNMLKKRQDLAMKILDSDPEFALQISIKNLAKIAMTTLELKNIFENSAEKVGKLFEKYFDFPHSDLPKKAYQFKINKEKILKDKKQVKQIVENTNHLLQSVIDFLK